MAGANDALSLFVMVGLRNMIISFGAPRRYWTKEELFLFDNLERAIAAAKR